LTRTFIELDDQTIAEISNLQGVGGKWGTRQQHERVEPNGASPLGVQEQQRWMKIQYVITI
jgi:hypothetical protein